MNAATGLTQAAARPSRPPPPPKGAATHGWALQATGVGMRMPLVSAVAVPEVGRRRPFAGLPHVNFLPTLN